MLEDLKVAMQTKFDMTDLGVMKYFLDIIIQQSSNVPFIGEQKYASDILQKFRMTNCNLANTPISQGTMLSKQDVAPPVDSTLYKSLVCSSVQLNPLYG